MPLTGDVEEHCGGGKGAVGGGSDAVTVAAAAMDAD